MVSKKAGVIYHVHVHFQQARIGHTHMSELGTAGIKIMSDVFFTTPGKDHNQEISVSVESHYVAIYYVRLIYVA